LGNKDWINMLNVLPGTFAQVVLFSYIYKKTDAIKLAHSL
jgi:hypothetical protein